MRGRYIPDEDLLRELRRLAEQLARTPTFIEMARLGRYGPTTYHARFGSWRDACSRAGLAPNPRGAEKAWRSRMIPDDALRYDFLRLAAHLGRPPTYTDVRRYGAYSTGPYLHRWGSWLRARDEILGTTPDGDHRP
jgi:hypothetical protein